jgi:hypothetical protein
MELLCWAKAHFGKESIAPGLPRVAKALAVAQARGNVDYFSSSFFHLSVSANSLIV